MKSKKAEKAACWHWVWFHTPPQTSFLWSTKKWKAWEEKKKSHTGKEQGAGMSNLKLYLWKTADFLCRSLSTEIDGGGTLCQVSLAWLATLSNVMHWQQLQNGKTDDVMAVVPGCYLRQTHNGCHLPWVMATRKASRHHLCSTVRSPHQNKPDGLDDNWGWSRKAPEEATDRKTLFSLLWDEYKEDCRCNGDQTILEI